MQSLSKSLFLLACAVIPLRAMAVLDIKTCTDLQNMDFNLSGDYQLVADIDCTDKVFTPVGNSQGAFKGSLNGNGHIIKNLYIYRTNDPYVGLFGLTSNGANSVSISNLILENVKVTGINTQTGGTSMQIGALIGNASTTYVYNVHVKGGTVTGGGESSREIGGLVGGMYGHSYISSSSTAVIISDVNTGAYSIGGLVGYLASASIDSSYATGPVSGDNDIGGLVGTADIEASITNSYATGNVSGNNYIGGLVGYSRYCPIKNSYSVGIVSSGTATQIGGLIGAAEGSSSYVTNSYWDMQTSGQANSAGGTSKTTAQMYQQNTYVGWDFKNIWGIVENKSYPFLLANK